MSKKYETHNNIDKPLLDSIKPGDLIKCNGRKMPLRVIAVTENFFVMARPCFREVLYSVCEKRPYPNGRFYISTDNMVFGSEHGYDWKTEEQAKEYLMEFEKGEYELSRRRQAPLREICIKRA